MGDDEWKAVGEISVDAGLCWIGDPCYILHRETPYKDLGKDWLGFCAKLNGPTIQFDHDLGSPGLGVAVSTGYGDGDYAVYAKFNKEGRVAEVKVVFIREEG